MCELSRAEVTPGPEVLGKECHTLGVTKESLSHTGTMGQPCVTILGQSEAQSASVCSSPQAFCLPRSALGLRAGRKNWCKMLWRC